MQPKAEQEARLKDKSIPRSAQLVFVQHFVAQAFHHGTKEPPTESPICRRFFRPVLFPAYLQRSRIPVSR